ncbi:Hypothetical_protein [Hexamita inflata]|uniref:Hypothetical_protein n=1 Tax=Hexamita inflata TaxID=28002 RepID=A0ABP1H7N9_9EUKA
MSNRYSYYLIQLTLKLSEWDIINTQLSFILVRSSVQDLQVHANDHQFQIHLCTLVPQLRQPTSIQGRHAAALCKYMLQNTQITTKMKFLLYQVVQQQLTMKKFLLFNISKNYHVQLIFSLLEYNENQLQFVLNQALKKQDRHNLRDKIEQKSEKYIEISKTIVFLSHQ